MAQTKSKIKSWTRSTDGVTINYNSPSKMSILLTYSLQSECVLSYLKKVKIYKFVVWQLEFKPILETLNERKLIEYKAVREKGNGVRGYFRITTLGLDYLKFQKL